MAAYRRVYDMRVCRCGPGGRWWQPTTGSMTMYAVTCDDNVTYNIWTHADVTEWQIFLWYYQTTHTAHKHTMMTMSLTTSGHMPTSLNGRSSCGTIRPHTLHTNTQCSNTSANEIPTKVTLFAALVHSVRTL